MIEFRSRMLPNDAMTSSGGKKPNRKKEEIVVALEKRGMKHIKNHDRSLRYSISAKSIVHKLNQEDDYKQPCKL